MAKLLYITTEARPDILTVVIFLCTRAQQVTVEDVENLVRVLGYLKGTVDCISMLHASGKTKAIAAYKCSMHITK
jgi:hypothetical protein